MTYRERLYVDKSKGQELLLMTSRDPFICPFVTE